MVSSSCVRAEFVRALVSGSVRRQCSFSACLRASSSLRKPSSIRRTSPRGTRPASSHRPRSSLSARRPALTSVNGSSFWPSARICSFTFRLAPYSRSISWFAALRAAKKTSWAARKRAQRASSSLREARGARFHSSIRSRYLPAVTPQSVEVDSSSARAMRRSLTCLASAEAASSREKWARRVLSNAVRAPRKRFHRSSSTDLARRGPAFWAAFHSSNSSVMRLDAVFQGIRSAGVWAKVSASATMASRVASCSAWAACRASCSAAR